MLITPVHRWLSSWLESDRNVIREAWDRLHGLPGGKRLFTEMIGRAAPYTSTIGATVVELRRGHSEVVVNDRRAIRNHLGSIHAVALANLAELTGNVAVAYTLPDDGRFIVAGMTVEYEKKARGQVVGTCTCPETIGSDKRELLIPVVIRDAAGDVCTRATLRTLVGPKPPRRGETGR